MSRKGKKDILLLYSKEESVQPWVDYILQCFNEAQNNIVIQAEHIEASLADVTSLCSGAIIVCLVVSDDLLETLERDKDILQPCFKKHVISVIELFLEPDQFKSKMADLYSISKWSCFEFVQEDDKNRQVVKDIVKLVNKTKKDSSCKLAFTAELSKTLVSQENFSTDDCEFQQPPEQQETRASSNQPETGARKKVPQVTPETPAQQETDSSEDELTKPQKGPDPKNMYHKVKKPSQQTKPVNKSLPNLGEICPNCIRKADEKVVLIFEGEIDASRMIQISINEKMYNTQRLNPYCYSFMAPAHKEGRATVRVHVDGAKVCKRHIRYLKPDSMAYSCPQYLTELLGLANLKELDNALATIFKSSVPGDNSLMHLLTPQTIAETAGTGQKNEDQLPTLLHFACYYGLQHLCTSITDIPGGHYALDVCNMEGKTPLDLAGDGGFEDIVVFLEDFKEMQTYITIMKELYCQMNPQMNSVGGYMAMNGRDTVDDYDFGRLGHVPEEDYISTSDLQPYAQFEIKLPPVAPPRHAVVEEVPEHSDIHDPLPDYSLYIEPEKPPERPPKSPARSLSPVTTRPVTPVTDPFFEDVIPKPKTSTGSMNQDELTELMDSYKHGELNMQDLETMFKAWQQRNLNCPSNSIKDKQKRLQDLKNNIMIKDTQKPGFFKRWTQKKPDPKGLVIEHKVQHNVNPNQYTTWPRMQAPRRPNSNRSSTSSTSSFSSTGSRISNLEHSTEEDGEEIPTPPPRPPTVEEEDFTPMVPPRPPSSFKNKPVRRLPTPPMVFPKPTPPRPTTPKTDAPAIPKRRN